MWLSQLLLWYCYFCSPAYSDRRKSLSLPTDLSLLIARQGTGTIFFSPASLYVYDRESEQPTIQSGWKNIYYLFTSTSKKRIVGVVWLALLFRYSFIRCSLLTLPKVQQVIYQGFQLLQDALQPRELTASRTPAFQWQPGKYLTGLGWGGGAGALS